MPKLWNKTTLKEQTHLIQQNDMLETNAIYEGIQRYRKTIDVIDPSSKRPEKVLIAHFLDVVADEILKEQLAIAKGMPAIGSPAIWYAPFLSIRAERLATIALSYMLQSPKQVGSVLFREIGEGIRNEVMLDEIRNTNKNKSTSQKGFSRDDSKKLIKNIKKIQRIYKRLTGGSGLKWKLSSKIQLGAKLVDIVNRATGGWITQVEWIKKNISKVFVLMNDELVSWLHEYHLDLEVVRPLKMPMCVPPQEWTFLDDLGMPTKKPTKEISGGFRVIKSEFITGRKGHHETQLNVPSMNPVFDAINHVQSTQWQIDTDILDVLEQIMSLNSPEYSNIIPVSPQKPVLPLIPTDNAARRLWHQNRLQQRSKWYAATSQRIAAIKCIDVAKRFKDLPVFFPHNIDFRGRIYPEASHISPQGNDLAKSLLLFAEAKPLGKNGLRNLKISAATHAGQDKITYQDREKWFDETWLPIITKTKKFDPFSVKWWVDYDNPLQFLKTLWDIQNAIHSGNPTSWKSCVSVSRDGSQNGIQHLSAMMRDEVGGRSVNLINSTLPNDLYQDVGNKVWEQIEADYLLDPTAKDKIGNDAPPVLWYSIFKEPKNRRKIVKRSVLAYPYGITIRGMHDAIIEDGFTENLQGSQYHNAQYLALAINDSVSQTVIMASKVMEYLRDIAKQLADQGFPVTWTTPLGLPVCQRYMWEESKTIKTCIHQIVYYIPNGQKKINVGNQVRGIVANIIHSWDSSHAGMIALMAKQAGINSLQFIHDSIGTHACDIDTMSSIIRETFINMHSADLLTDLVDELQKQYKITLPPPPTKGSLDIEEVRNSTWFFS